MGSWVARVSAHPLKMAVSALFLSLSVLVAIVVAIQTKDFHACLYAVSLVILLGNVVGRRSLLDVERCMAQGLRCLEAIRAGRHYRVTRLDFHELIPNWVDGSVRQLHFVRLRNGPGHSPISAWGAYTDPFGESLVICTDDGLDELSGLAEYFALHELGHVSSFGGLHKQWGESRLRLVLFDVLPLLALADGWVPVAAMSAASTIVSLLIPPSVHEASADNTAVAHLLRRHGRRYTTEVVHAVNGIVKRELRAADLKSEDRSATAGERADATARFIDRVGQAKNLEFVLQLLRSDKPIDPEKFEAHASPLQFFLMARILFLVSAPFWLVPVSHAPSRPAAYVALAAVVITFVLAVRAQSRLVACRERVARTLAEMAGHSAPLHIPALKS